MTRDELLKQVGKTVNGEPISEEQFQAIVDSIVTGLELEPTDIVVDLCCGNGLVTKEVAKKCKWIVGVDESKEMVSTARFYNRAKNIEYSWWRAQNYPHRMFWKAFIYEAMQYFTESDFIEILKHFTQWTSISTIFSTIFLGSIPDRDKRWHFYDTEAKRVAHIDRVMDETEQIPEWWSFEDIRVMAEPFGFVAERIEQNPILHTAHYRYDVVMRRKG